MTHCVERHAPLGRPITKVPPLLALAFPDWKKPYIGYPERLPPLGIIRAILGTNLNTLGAILP